MEAFDDTDEEAIRPTALLHDLAQLTGICCATCAHHICGHEALFCIVMGLKKSPRCLTCLAVGLGRSAGELLDDMVAFIHQRDCYRQAWKAANEQEGAEDSGQPACLWPVCASRVRDRSRIDPSMRPERPLDKPPVACWDAGEMSCGDLVMELRERLSHLAPADVLQVIAHDAAAPEDLPAWCRLTGHRLLQTKHPVYLIQRKEP